MSNKPLVTTSLTALLLAGLVAPVFAQAPQPQPYPQQPYPQQPYPQQPQQPYPPQPYPQQPYPQQPQQPYPQQPAYPPTYQQPYAPPPPPPPPLYSGRLRQGLMVMPFLGLHTVSGQEATATQDAAPPRDPGFRLGAAIGGYFSRSFSLGGELAINFINLGKEFEDQYNAAGLSISIVPTFHFDAGQVEFLLGPKLGYHAQSYTLSDDNDTGLTVSGGVLGANFGVFWPTGGSAFGILGSYEGHFISETCLRSPGLSDDCQDEDNVDADKFFTLNLAFLH